MNGMEKITARMKEDAARSLSELNAQIHTFLNGILQELHLLFFCSYPRRIQEVHI